MYKINNKIRTMLLVTIILGIVSISISYASMSTTLNIRGRLALSKSATWDIYFNDLSDAKITGSTKELKKPVITGDTYIEKFDVLFEAPKDTISYTFDIVNDGDFDAVLTTLDLIEPKCQSNGIMTESELNKVCANINYNFKVGNNNLNIGTVIPKHSSKKVTLKISYDGTELPKEAVSIENLGATMIFAQY